MVMVEITSTKRFDDDSIRLKCAKIPIDADRVLTDMYKGKAKVTAEDISYAMGGGDTVYTITLPYVQFKMDYYDIRGD